MLRLSVIIPTYNHSKSLARAVQSVALQQKSCDELIIVDDGSTDDTQDVLQTLTTKFPTLKKISQINAGPAAARNHGVRCATGDYFLFLDSDDELLEGALDTFRKACEDNPQGSVFFAGHLSKELNGKERSHYFPALGGNKKNNFLRYLRKELSPVNGATLFRQDAFQIISYPEQFRSCEDICVFAHALALLDGVALRQPTVRVYKSADSLRHALSSNQRVGLSLVDVIFDKTRLPASLMKYRKEYFSRRCLSLFRALYAQGNCKEARGFYHLAIKTYPSSMFIFSYLKKYLKSFF